MSIAEHDAGHYLKAARQLATSVAANADRIDRERQIPPELAGEIADQGFSGSFYRDRWEVRS